ncbi:H-NS histone family protein [Paraburkholderia hospita]|jgi:DNA-binding protein H-NS|uniref:Histidine biosynthesis protein n=1 Tax=Paraburkholderia hospita TaxID=169430 RepID=A0AAN1JER6_9BURK|nr:H-NS histone family protein [Paraburkholderia hospita]SOE84727.1 DNA-binding protein H-NS [Burkholderia sp. YR290]AUT72591.1 histidine biosynthesis protein [Paraburkholderia hospita]EIM97628.1 histone family protein nucleoid-structuring protein H-NS [Paraburkholderia hospita]OUL68618.1 histidine biosynthesis protein [Paraburkholderia hospita]OUL70986.1 histidine biosynthesis protein [Paraburkholderia hospita]
MATLEIIQARIKKLQTQAETLLAKRAQGALDQIRELMIKHGLTTEDIERRAKARRERERKVRLGVSSVKAGIASAVKGKLPPKYRDPKTGATWSGHARPPAWIKDVKDRSKFLIDAAAAAAEPAVTAKAATKKTAAKKAVAKKAVTAKSAGRKVAKKASAGAKAAVKKAAVKKVAAKKAAGKKTAAKKVAAKSAAPTAGKRVIAKKAAAKKTSASKAPAKKAAAKKAPVKSVAPVAETPVTVQTPTPSTGEA